MQDVNKICRYISEGLSIRQVQKMTGLANETIISKVGKAGFSNRELKWLGNKKDRRRVVGIEPWKKIPVYDMTVAKHHNFCTNWGIAHNCQRDEHGRVMQVV